MATAQHTGLFYLGAAPTAAREKFPVRYNRRVFGQRDTLFLVILSICAVAMGVTFFLLSLRPLPETFSEKDILKIQERYAQLILNQPKPKIQETAQPVQAPVTESKKTARAEDAEEKIKTTVDRKSESVLQKTQRKEATSADRRKQRETISRQLQSSGIFAAITASGSGQGGGASPVTDLLGSAAEAIGDIGQVDISKGTFASRDVDPQQVMKSRRGATTGGVSIEKETAGSVSGAQIASVGSVNITSRPPEITGESAGRGSRTMDAIEKVVNQQKNLLKKVYESMLKRDPTLSGRLKIKFTILPDGAVTDVSIVESTTNNPTFDGRIISYIKRWKFTPVDGGSPVEVVYPFVFSGAA